MSVRRSIVIFFPDSLFQQDERGSLREQKHSTLLFDSPEGWVANFTGDKIAGRFPLLDN